MYGQGLECNVQVEPSPQGPDPAYGPTNVKRGLERESLAPAGYAKQTILRRPTVTFATPPAENVVDVHADDAD